MEILYDVGGRRQRKSVPSGEALAEALTQVQQELAAAGEVAVGIVVGERRVEPTPVAVLAHLEETATLAHTLRVESMEAAAVLAETAVAAGDYCGHVLERLPELADQLYAGEPVEARVLEELFEGLGWIAEYVAVVLPLLEQPDAASADASSLQTSLYGAVQRLEQLEKDFDPVLLGDLLIDEVRPVLASIRQQTLQLIERRRAEGWRETP